MSDPQEPAEGTPRAAQSQPRPAAAPLTVSHAVLALRDELRMCDTHAARELALESFWATHPRTPILETNNPGRAFAEGHYTVTFLWQDAEAEEVLLVANRITDEGDLAASLMRRVPGTDLWHLSYRMRGDWRASYGFMRRMPGEPRPWAHLWGQRAQVADPPERGRALTNRALRDPRNPHQCRDGLGTLLSVVSLPDAAAQPWLELREDLAARGQLSERSGPDGRRVWIYEPPTTLGELPIVVLLDGEVWAEAQDIATTVDNLLADAEMRPCLLVMPAAVGPGLRQSGDTAVDSGIGSGNDSSTDAATESESTWIADRLLPWVREQYPASEHAADVLVAGQGLGGYTALRTALEHPDKIGAVLSQSASLWQRRLPAPDLALIHQLHVYLEVGSQEGALRGPNERLASEFTRFGCDTHFVEYNGGDDYACWRGGIAEGLRTLLGPPAS